MLPVEIKLVEERSNQDEDTGADETGDDEDEDEITSTLNRD